MDGIVYMRRCIILVLYLIVIETTTTSRTKSFDLFVACLQQPTRTSSTSSSTTTSISSTTTTTTIQVCQNKACCQRWKLKTSLPDVLHDLLYDNTGNNQSKILIDVTSCLSQCDKGPNLCIIDTSNNNNNKKRDDIYVNGINDVIPLITQLDEILSINVSSKLLAATNVYEKALNAPTKEEKLRYTSSILRVLDDDPNLSKSTVKFRTSLYHAEIIFDSGNDQDAMNILNEVIPQLLVLLSENNNIHYYKNLLSKAYRIIADIYEHNQNYTSAIDAVQCIGKINPEMKSKVIKEIDRLQQLITN